MKVLAIRLSVVFALLALLGCGGSSAPEPASYCGNMPDSGHFGLSGRVVLVISTDMKVVGTLQDGPTRYEIRGEVQDNGAFSGVMDGPTDYNISGTINSSRAADATVSWTIHYTDNEDDHVTFPIGDC